jgi:NADPH2:quinone reductase
MRAVLLREFGSIAGLALADLPDPEPGPDEVVVAVRAVAANYVDLLVISGTYQFLPETPFSPGKLPVGEVLAVGAGVTNVRPGDRVLTLAEHGGYAERIKVSAVQCFVLPPGMSYVDAASMALAYDTAWFAIRERGRFQPGERVLVLGSTGAVGLAAVQLAKAFGAEVFAGVSGMDRAATVRAAGADHVIDLSQQPLRDTLRDQVGALSGGRGVDIILDPLGGEFFAAALRALAWRGRLVVIGFASGDIPSVKANYLLVKNIEVSGLQISDYRKRMPEIMAVCLEEVFSLYQDGRLRPAPATTYRLDDFSNALSDLTDRRSGTRIVLVPDRERA